MTEPKPIDLVALAKTAEAMVHLGEEAVAASDAFTVLAVTYDALDDETKAALRGHECNEVLS